MFYRVMSSLEAETLSCFYFSLLWLARCVRSGEGGEGDELVSGCIIKPVKGKEKIVYISLFV